MDLGLTHKVALVTGGSRGIGRGVAQVLSREGAQVAICSRDEEMLAEAAAAIEAESGQTPLMLAADLTRSEDLQRVAEETVAKLGRVDILVNNAGSSVFGYFDTLADEEWVSGFELKFFGYVRLTRLLLPQMKANGGGVIINVIGNAGRVPMAWHMPGGAANAALINFTKSLANQVGGDGIRVNAVNPGPTETDRWENVVRFFASTQDKSGEQVRRQLLERTPLGRFSTVEDIGNAVAFLASERAGNITGTMLTVDGGATAIP